MIKRDLTTEEGIRGFLEEKKAMASKILQDTGALPPVAFLASDDFPLGPAILHLVTLSQGKEGQTRALQFIKDQVKKYSAYAVVFIMNTKEIVGYTGEIREDLIEEAVSSGKAKARNMILFHVDHKQMGSRVWGAEIKKDGEVGELEYMRGAIPTDDLLRFIPSSEKAN